MSIVSVFESRNRLDHRVREARVDSSARGAELDLAFGNNLIRDTQSGKCLPRHLAGDRVPVTSWLNWSFLLRNARSDSFSPSKKFE